MIVAKCRITSGTIGFTQLSISRNRRAYFRYDLKAKILCFIFTYIFVDLRHFSKLSLVLWIFFSLPWFVHFLTRKFIYLLIEKKKRGTRCSFTWSSLSFRENDLVVKFFCPRFASSMLQRNFFFNQTLMYVSRWHEMLTCLADENFLKFSKVELSLLIWN